MSTIFRTTGLGVRYFLAAGLLAASPHLATAQNYPTCYNTQNLAVTYLPDTSVQDVAEARTSSNGMPIVVWNPNVMSSLHPNTAEFFYYHECAHHVMGHPLGTYGRGSERSADCWAKRTMRQSGVLTADKYRVIRNELERFSRPGMDWPNGTVRVNMLDSC